MPSFVIDDFHYDADAHELTIWFKTGLIYIYFAVPEQVYADFSTAFSKGTYFNRHIRDHYQFRELTPAGDAPS